MQQYPKRHYSRFSDLIGDVRSLSRQRVEVRRLGRGASIDKAFQERIMLAVTEVNGCRYCAYAHSRVALAAGLPKAEVEALAWGSFAEAPPEQVPALLYAQHWAESDTHPDAEARQAVLEIYGPEKTAAIELAMRMIRMGNLLGNTGDYLLYRLSFGHWGRSRSSRVA